MMPRPAPDPEHPPDNLSEITPDQEERVTHHELVAAGITYRQVDLWTRAGWLRCDNPRPGSGRGRHRRYPASELAVVATMARLAAAGIPPSVAVIAARNDGWIASGIRIELDPSVPVW